MSHHDSDDEVENGIERSIGEEPLMTSLTKRQRRKAMLYLIVANVAILTLVICIIVLVLGVSIGVHKSRSANVLPSDPYERADTLLADFPLIDG